MPQHEGNHIRDMCVRRVDFDRHAEALAKKTHCFESFLVIGSTATHENVHAVRDEGCLELF